ILDGLADLGAELRRGLGEEHRQRAVARDVEDLRSLFHADAVTPAKTRIDDHAHQLPAFAPVNGHAPAALTGAAGSRSAAPFPRAASMSRCASSAAMRR